MTNLSQEQYIDMYPKMQRIYEFDMRTNKLVRRSFVRGMTHLSAGEETASVGAMAHLIYDDITFSSYRRHGQYIAKDMDLDKMVAELAGKVTGMSKGRGGSMYLVDFEKGNYGTNGIAGGGYALAVGATLTQHYQKTDNIVVAFSGDGATDEDSFHESVDLVATWGPPIILFIINNRYDISMDIIRAANTPYLYTRAETYDIPDFRCEDGSDALAVYETMGRVVDYVRPGNGPAVVEVESYRWLGHSTADVDKYRSKEEVDNRKKEDPFVKFRTCSTENCLANHDELNATDAQVVREIDDAYAFAQGSPRLDLSVAFEDAWVGQAAF